jgi:6-phosphogluconolactonase
MILYAGSFTEMIDDFLGGHGEGIYCFDFDPRSGLLKWRHRQSAANPSYLSIPSAKYLYTHTEVLAAKSPRVQAYRIDEHDFSLQFINEQPLPGGCPCHISYSKQHNAVLVSCYETGNLLIYPTDKDGKLLPHSKIIQHEGSSTNKVRQESAHPHAAVIDEEFNNILVPDLGMDKIMAYRLKSENGKFTEELIQEVSVPPGSGPRHMAIDSGAKLVYLLSELTATITVMRNRGGDLEVIGTYRTLAEDFSGIPSAAAIRISVNGKFIYISERISHCITVLRFDSDLETLETIGKQSSMGKTPRDIQIDPTGNWLLAANQDSDSIAVFKIDEHTGMMKPEHLVEHIKSPVCLQWLPDK